MSEKVSKRTISTVGITLLIVLFVIINGLSRGAFESFYVDLTEEGLYSVSDGTKSTISAIESPITLRFYFSKTNAADSPALKLYGRRVADLLKEYERLGDGKITLEIYDPLPDTEEEEWAEKYGLTAMQSALGNRLYLGLAGSNAQGVEEIIPLFNLSRQQTLEYDITKLVYSLSLTKKPSIGILSSLPINGGETPPQSFPGQQPPTQEPWYFISQLEAFGEVDFLDTEITQIPDKIETLLIIHPKNFSNELLYAVDQFVLRGGRLFLALDPHCQADIPPPNPQNPMAARFADRSSSFEKLLTTWGVTFTKEVVGDRKLATKVNVGRGQAPQDFVLFLSLRNLSKNEKIINKVDLVTNELENLLLPWAGAFKTEEKEGITFDPLLSSSTDSRLYKENEYKFADNPEKLLSGFNPDKTQHVLALRVRGNFKSAFPEGSPTTTEEEKISSSVSQHLKSSVGASNVVIVGDVDFLADPYSVQVQSIFGATFATRINDNLVFLQNVVENLLGSDDLINLRSRGQFSRPFTKVIEIELRAQERWLEEEKVLQAKLKAANNRLTQLQSSSGSDKLMTSALLEEIKQFRDERQETRKRLREVKRNLRKDKQRLGDQLFLLNTFAVPLLLIIISIAFSRRRNRKNRQ